MQEGLEERVAVGFDRAHAVAGERIGERAAHRDAVFEHVGGARRATEIVFENEVFAVMVADEIGAADVDVNVARNIEVHELAPEVFGAEDQGGGDDFVLQNLLPVVEIVQEKVERGDALDEAGLELGPFGARDDAGNEVERENALGALRIVIDREGDHRGAGTLGRRRRGAG